MASRRSAPSGHVATTTTTQKWGSLFTWPKGPFSACHSQLARSAEHVELLQELAPRASRADATEAAAKCREQVHSYFRDRDVLDSFDVRQVTAPFRPSDKQIQFTWQAAINAAKRKDAPALAKWKGRAEHLLSLRGVKA